MADGNEHYIRAAAGQCLAQWGDWMRALSDELAGPRSSVVARSSEQEIASMAEVPEEIMQVDTVVRSLSTWPQACIHRRYLWRQSDYAAVRELRVPATVYRQWHQTVICHITERLLYRKSGFNRTK